MQTCRHVNQTRSSVPGQSRCWGESLHRINFYHCTCNCCGGARASSEAHSGNSEIKTLNMRRRFVAGTAHNRISFVGAVRRALAHLVAPAPASQPPMHHQPAPTRRAADARAHSHSPSPSAETRPPHAAGPSAPPPRLTAGDYHSLLQMLCMDWPLGPMRKAWGAACSFQAGADQVSSIRPSGLPNTVPAGTACDPR
jgi:hypothetical protein